MLFIYYLFHQLGFTIEQIIAAAPGLQDGVLNATAPLRGVYKNLTSDDSDPFPFFKQLLDDAYPETRCRPFPGRTPTIRGRWPRFSTGASRTRSARTRSPI